MFIYKPDNLIGPEVFSVPLEKVNTHLLQGLVGGYITIIKELWVANEDGIPLKLDLNYRASLEFGAPLFGVVVLLTKEEAAALEANSEEGEL
jgi:hypothetical protein